MKSIKYSSILAAAVLSTSSASAALITVGDSLGGRASVDGWAGLYIQEAAITAPAPTTTAGTIVDVNFTARAGREAITLTPLLWSSTDGGASYAVAGIGAATSGYAGGDHTIPFNLSSGVGSFDTATAGTTYHIGMGMWNADGNSRSADGLIEYDGNAGGTWDAGNEGETVSVGTVFASAAQQGRLYSYQNTIDFVPEPSAFLLIMGAGFAGILRRRR